MSCKVVVENSGPTQKGGYFIVLKSLNDNDAAGEIIDEVNKRFGLFLIITSFNLNPAIGPLTTRKRARALRLLVDGRSCQRKSFDKVKRKHTKRKNLPGTDQYLTETRLSKFKVGFGIL